MRQLLLAMAGFWVLFTGCGGGAGSDAPGILYGEDICDRCRMVISEQRHAAAARLDGHGHRFDDPGCLQGFLEANRGAANPVAWVHDETGSWLAVEEAWFVEDPERGTPMASGILAFGSRQAAGVAGRRFGAEPRRWTELEVRGEASAE